MISNVLETTKGCDPELFFVDKDGNFISSIDKIGGSKLYPKDIGEGCAVQEDNVAVEFNTPPCKTADDFVKYINYNLSFIKDHASKLGLDIRIVPSAHFSKEELSDHRALEFGCEPDFNAWKDGRRNPRPRASDSSLRSAGGHIHIGFDHSKVDMLEVVKAMDLYVGCLMLEFDSDNQRRELYGKAGAFRPKPYGVEYRTASNAWIKSDDLIRWVWNQTDKAIAYAMSGKGFTKEQGKIIQDCINNSDLKLLEVLKKEFNL